MSTAAQAAPSDIDLLNLPVPVASPAAEEPNTAAPAGSVPAPALQPATPAAAPARSRSAFRRYRNRTPDQILGRISNFTQPKLGPADTERLLAEQDALYLSKISSYLQAQNATWHQGNPSDNSAFGYYNGTQLPGQYPSSDSGRKLLQSITYTAAVQAALLANNTPQTNITIKGELMTHDT